MRPVLRKRQSGEQDTAQGQEIGDRRQEAGDRRLFCGCGYRQKNNNSGAGGEGRGVGTVPRQSYCSGPGHWDRDRKQSAASEQSYNDLINNNNTIEVQDDALSAGRRYHDINE